MRLLAAGLVLVSTISAAENIQVEVKAVHAVTHTDNSANAIADKSLFGAHAIDRQQESATWMRSSKANMLFWPAKIPKVANRLRLEPIRQSSSGENLFI